MQSSGRAERLRAFFRHRARCHNASLDARQRRVEDVVEGHHRHIVLIGHADDAVETVGRHRDGDDGVEALIDKILHGAELCCDIGAGGTTNRALLIEGIAGTLMPVIARHCVVNIDRHALQCFRGAVMTSPGVQSSAGRRSMCTSSRRKSCWSPSSSWWPSGCMSG
jgi:hypothetical protein